MAQDAYADSSARDYADLLARDLGPQIMNLIDDEDVTEIGTNPFSDVVWKESRRAGHKLPSGLTLSKQHVRSFLNRSANGNGHILNSDTPRIECALPEEYFYRSRLTGHVPPKVAAPSFTLRKLPREAYPLENYLEWKTFTESQFSALVEAIREHLNIAVVGGTSTGKTTLAMSILRKAGEIDPYERLVTLEQVPELRVDPPWRWYPMYTHGDKGYTHLIEDAMRSSPGRLIVGESRGRSLLDLLDAFLTGHDGGVFTFHAGTVEKALSRMYNYCNRASETSTHHQTIGEALDLMIILQRTGQIRLAKEMVRVHGYSEETGYDLEHLS